MVHYLWLVKADIRQPLIYAAILTFLLAVRLLLKWRPRLFIGLASGASSVP